MQAVKPKPVIPQSADAAVDPNDPTLLDNQRGITVLNGAQDALCSRRRTSCDSMEVRSRGLEAFSSLETQSHACASSKMREREMDA